MKRGFLIFVLLVAINSYAAKIMRGPYLEDPTQTTVVMRWQTDVSTPAWLEYGPAPRCNQIMKISAESTDHKAVLYGLVPNQEFCYRLYIYNAARSGVQNPVEGTFRTLYTPERKEVHFVATGNTAGDNFGAKLLLSDQMAAAKADFWIHTGNLTTSGLNEDANAQLFTPYKDTLQSTPLFIAVGPNEYGPERGDRESKSFFRSNYSRFHDMTWSTATPKYYSFDTANARFIFLDANITQDAVWAPEIDDKSAQYKWLQTALAGAAEKWKIVVLNTPLYSTGENGPVSEAAAHLVPLFERYGVHLVLQGGEADYERTFPLRADQTHPRGVTYMTLGGGGATPKRRDGTAAYTARFLSAYHFADIKIVDRKLRVKVFNEKGEMKDHFDLYL